MRSTLALTFALLCAETVYGINIETVPVSDVGNANDPATGDVYGGVNYPYSIGKYEVTVGQYAAFLNAVAMTDTYGLYAYGGYPNIARRGTSGSYSYSSVLGSSNLPVEIARWGDAARFANWLHNGQPTGAQNANTTEDGAYTLNGATSSEALYAITRNANAQWFLPSENEWYKAAYYQPAAQGGDSDNYWNYPMRTNSEPYSDQPPGVTPDNTRVGNFYKDDGMTNGYDDGFAVTGSTVGRNGVNYLTGVGAYLFSPSYYGTFDQGGNVWEWNEAQYSALYRGVRGGSVVTDVKSLSASYSAIAVAGDPHLYVGFRVATVVPEPSTALLVGIAAVAFGCLCRRRA